MARHLDLQTMEEETAATENKTDFGHCSVGASADPNIVARTETQEGTCLWQIAQDLGANSISNSVLISHSKLKWLKTSLPSGPLSLTSQWSYIMCVKNSHSFSALLLTVSQTPLVIQRLYHCGLLDISVWSLQLSFREVMRSERLQLHNIQ